MLQNINKLSERQYKSTIGIGKKDFQELTVIFSQISQDRKAAYYEEFEAYYDRKPSAGGTPVFALPSEQLFFTLFYLKNYPTFDVLGFIFGCSGKTAHENLYKFLPILEDALQQLEVLPKRTFDDVEAFIEFTKTEENLLIDATERLHHRKKKYEEQKKYYNGKQKDHTVKNTVISNTDQIVLFLGHTVPGAKHDYGLFKQEFPPEFPWFKQSEIWIDLGYLGFGKDYEPLSLNIPFKKPYKTKNNPDPKLTPEQKQHNTAVGSVRVKVENAIGGVKRFRILVQRFRNKSEMLRDKAIFFAAGIWNFSKGFSFSS